ncbi:hypothetical protein HQ535_04255 [bacterium]|nr:hypothetical protein [bacterium]
MEFTVENVIRFIHLLSATIWVGGMVSMINVLPTLHRMGLHGADVRTVSRSFGTVGFPAMVIAMGTGVWKTIDAAEVSTALWVKVGLSAAALLLGLWYAREASGRGPAVALPAIRLLLLLSGVGLVAASIAL